jgi:REP element-mobilizing transposase RayT
MGHTSTNLLVHVIFSTKQRAQFITAEIESDLHAYLGGIIREIGGVALAIYGSTDHVHILTRVPAKHSIATAGNFDGLDTQTLNTPSARFGGTSSYMLRLSSLVSCFGHSD